MNAELLLDILQTVVVDSILFSLAFVLGACWHHWHLDIEQAKDAAGTEGRL
jgi:hypothetical protein